MPRRKTTRRRTTNRTYSSRSYRRAPARRRTTRRRSARRGGVQTVRLVIEQPVAQAVGTLDSAYQNVVEKKKARL